MHRNARPRRGQHQKPFYHTVTVRFTASAEMNHSELEERLRGAIGSRPVLRDTVEVDSLTVEEGNTGDLMP